MRSTLLGPYRITGSIGVGGMGAVYRAEHTLLGRPAAIKVLLPELSQNQEIVTRFFNEARAAAAIQHPSIVEIYDFGWDSDGSAYIVMEHLQGESLAARLSRGRMPVPTVVTIVRQIAGALAAAHQRGIVHRDLKPDNIFLVPDLDRAGSDRIKLLDFGVAKLIDSNTPGMMTRPGAILGTPAYMAPEQVRGAAIDHRADLYSLGCILFELCTGRPPFLGNNVGEVLIAQVHKPPPTLSSLVPEIPLEFEMLVQQLLVKDVASRMQSADAVVQAIDAAAGAAFRTGQVVAGGAGATAPERPSSPPPSAGATAAERPPPPPLSAGATAAERPLSTALSSAAGGVTAPPGARKRSRWILGVGGVVVLSAVFAAVGFGVGVRWPGCIASSPDDATAGSPGAAAALVAPREPADASPSARAEDATDRSSNERSAAAAGPRSGGVR